MAAGGLLAAALVACAPGGGGPEAGPRPGPEAPEPDVPEAPVEPERAPRHPVPTAEPSVRVGLSLGADSVVVASEDGLSVEGLVPDCELNAGPGVALTAGLSDGRVELRGPGRGAPTRFRRIVAAPAGASPVTVDGTAYRGRVELYARPPHGLVLVNELPLEAYLLGVVPVEIGPRDATEAEAVKAQAVAARTYAVRNLGRRDSLGFDVFGSVEDQVYGGRDVERPDASRAVRATEGRVLVHEDEPIRAYYHSTGGGWTARVSDVWNLPDAPYLRRVSDRRPGGGDYCDISPRYRWEERWTRSELEASVRRGLQEYFGLEETEAGGAVRSVEVLSRSEEGRIQRLALRTAQGRYVVTRNDIRFFLRTPDDRVLRSTRFEVVETPRDGGGLTLSGRGYGHGIGMCQWGAIGRARSGEGYREILAHYYPGTELVRAYGSADEASGTRPRDAAVPGTPGPGSG